MKYLHQKNGFTLIELMVVMGLIALLFTISTLSLANVESESKLNEFVSEIKMSLAKAQSQTINGNFNGVYFETNRYIIFSGDRFVEGDPNNQIVILPSGLRFSIINLPSQTLTFAKITGYVNNYSAPENITLLEEATGKTRQITINKLGVVEIQ